MTDTPADQDQALLVLDAAAVRRLLTMERCIEAMDRAMRATSAGDLVLPLRQFTELADGSGTLGVMPGAALEPPVYGVKVIGQHPDNPSHGRPAIQGLVLLFDHATGRPILVMDGAEVTGIRTAAASGLATRVLAREDARTLGILGTGVQARTHVDAVLAVRPIEEIRVWGRNRAHAEDFARETAARTGIEVRVAEPRETCAADVVCGCTSATEPVLEGSWLRPGAHVNLVGTHTPDAREADAEAMTRARVWVDSLDSARAEAGDIVRAVEDGAMTFDEVVGEIGQVLLDEVPGRESAEEITLYKSVGLVSQDLFAAEAALRAARAESEGASR